MKTLLFLALAGLVLTVVLAIPFNEDDQESQENTLKDIAEDYGEEDPDQNFKVVVLVDVTLKKNEFKKIVHLVTS